MKNNELIVKCIKAIKGLTKGKIYEVSVIRKANDSLLNFFIKDDNGQYNEFKSDNFQIVDCYVEL